MPEYQLQRKMITKPAPERPKSHEAKAGERRSQLLYNDSRVRKAKMDYCQAKRLAVKPANVPIDLKSQNYIQSRLTHEFQGVKEQLGLGAVFNLEETFEVFVRMGFLKSLHLH